MTEIHFDLAETTVDGPGTRHWSLTRDDCPELAVHRIKHLGMTAAADHIAACGCSPPGAS